MNKYFAEMLGTFWLVLGGFVSAVLVRDWAIGHLWLFWIAPIIGVTLGALTYRFIAIKE